MNGYKIGGSISGNGDNIGNGISLSYNGYSIAIAAPPRYYINGPFSYRESDGHVLVYTFDHSLSISSPSTLIVKKTILFLVIESLTVLYYVTITFDVGITKGIIKYIKQGGHK